MLNFFRGRKSATSAKPPRAPGDTIRDNDLSDLLTWVSDRVLVEAFVEPETLVNEMSVVLVDATGDFIRRPIGGPKGIDVIASRVGCPVYDVEDTGYPQRMREKIERDRLLRQRAEAAERRKKFEQGKNPYEP